MPQESKYGAVTTERGTLKENEPVFILRAQDLLAPDAIAFYAELRKKAGDTKGAIECLRVAQKFLDWDGPKKMPD